MLSEKLKKGISELTFYQRSLLFAELSAIAYLDEKDAKKHASELGFTTVEFYNIEGAQAYRFMNKHDMVIACRGTQPTEYNDIKADLNALPIISETVSRVHMGFKAEVDELWPHVKEDMDRKVNLKKDHWFCGHSLGAAMATIMASRCKHDPKLSDPVELYTYGSPRVGWKRYCDSLEVEHNRFVNNNDIVTTVPLVIMGFRHHGTCLYFNTWGNLRELTFWQKIKDKLRGMWRGLKAFKIDNFSDHNMSEYIKHCDKLVKGMETPQV